MKAVLAAAALALRGAPALVPGIAAALLPVRAPGRRCLGQEGATARAARMGGIRRNTPASRRSRASCADGKARRVLRVSSANARSGAAAALRMSVEASGRSGPSLALEDRSRRRPRQPRHQGRRGFRRARLRRLRSSRSRSLQDGRARQAVKHRRACSSPYGEASFPPRRSATCGTTSMRGGHVARGPLTSDHVRHRGGARNGGNAHAGQWVEESRDVAADFRAAFAGWKGPVPQVSGVVAGNDTDQTGETVLRGSRRFPPRRRRPPSALVLLGGGHAQASRCCASLAEHPDDRRRGRARHSVVAPRIYRHGARRDRGPLRARRQRHRPRALAARAAGAALVLTGASSVRPIEREVVCADASVIPYDVLSLDVGSTPVIGKAQGVERYRGPGAARMEALVRGWVDVRARAREGKVGSITVVGGGAGGVELAFAMEHGMRRELKGDAPHVRIIADTPVAVARVARQARARRFRQAATRTNATIGLLHVPRAAR